MRKLMLAGLLITAAGCASRKDLEKAQTEATSLAAEKDSLLGEVLATSKLVSDINSELAKAKGLGVSPTTTTENAASNAGEDRQILLGKIREAVARLNESEAQLERTKARIGSLERKDARLLKQIDDFQKQIAELRTNIEAQQATIEEQKTTIASQKVQIEQITAQVETVTVKNRQLADSVTMVSNEANKVFLAIGPKDSLKEKGVIVQEGKKFLVFGGKQTVPARDLNPAAFQVLDARTDRSITLPEGKKYKIVSRQDPKLLQPGPDDKGKLVGTQTITNPGEFWGASKYLIIVED
jgi:predicted  nucleic acid-binding Zn-ribbon protein